MQIKDIVNRDIVNLTNCEQEPIHIPGSIQSHGFLLAFDSSNGLIEFASGNLEQFTGIGFDQVLGKTFTDVFDETVEKSLQAFIAGADLKSPSTWELSHGRQIYTCHIHRSGKNYIVEAQPKTGPDRMLSDVYTQTRQFLSYMESTHTLQDLCMRVSANIREMTGYDRVMIYRFDHLYNGEVFAESRRDDLEPFIGLHYPHTDIPVQARELYLRNLVRLIPDTGYQPVPVYTIDYGSENNLDLSLSVLRSVSPIHIQYLQNMGVGATLTISLLYKQQLWGLIACHHYSPKNLSAEMRIAAQLQGHFITSQIDTRKQNEEYELSLRCNDALEKCMGKTMLEGYDSLRNLIANPNLLNLCNANGVALLVNDHLYTNGTTPGDQSIRKLIDKIRERISSPDFVSSAVPEEFPDHDNLCDSAAGVVFHALTADYAVCILWFRVQTISEVHWAGDPSKAIIKDSKGLSPRNSFELWKEVVRCTSKPWLEPERNAAARYAYTLQKQISLLVIAEEEKKYRELSELLTQTNAELENINWISAHDLQEPLRKIQLFSSHLLYRQKEKTGLQEEPLIQKIRAAAARMQNQLKDILKYTRIRYNEIEPEIILTDQLIRDIEKDMRETSTGVDFDLTVGELPAIHGVLFLIRQLFVNLMNNSLKFAERERRLRISIIYGGIVQNQDLAPDRNYHLIIFSDNGIGFEPEFSETIFKVFSRLHSHTEYEGSGIGLALCRKVMQMHRGNITAEGKPGAGATFNLYFPCDQ